VAKDFAVDDAMVADFQKFVESRRVKMDQAAWTQDRAFIAAMIRFEIDAAVFGMGVARRRLLEVDPQAQHALALFPKAEQLLTLAKTRTTRAGQGAK
jgi:carboxyl-terminal processing protease